jgi:hypothetical protein
MVLLSPPSGAAGQRVRPPVAKGNTVMSIPCVIEIESKVWDLSAVMDVEIFETENPHGPQNIIHEDQDFLVRVHLQLKGRILHYLCGSLCVVVGFESCGTGCEIDLDVDQALDPCGNGEYYFNIPVRGGTLKAGRCSKSYDVCVSLGSFDYCKHPGFVFGRCEDIGITIVPAVVD